MKELSNCPFCEGDFNIKKVECQCCGTQIKGDFKPNRFHMFAPEDLLFIELFLVNEGNIKLMEKELGISYPTVKNRLKHIVQQLGYQQTPSRTEILKSLSEGSITVDDALKKLGESS